MLQSRLDSFLCFVFRRSESYWKIPTAFCITANGELHSLGFFFFVFSLCWTIFSDPLYKTQACSCCCSIMSLWHSTFKINSIPSAVYTQWNQKLYRLTDEWSSQRNKPYMMECWGWLQEQVDRCSQCYTAVRRTTMTLQDHRPPPSFRDGHYNYRLP